MRVAVPLLLLATVMPAQGSALLAIERPQDRPARERIYRMLAEQRVDVTFAEATPREVARTLTALTGDRINFVVLDEAAGAAPLTLELRQIPVTTVLDQVQRQTGLRLVLRGGVIGLAEPADVHELLSLRILDVRAATTPLPNFPGPELALTRGDESGVTVAAEPEPSPPPSGLDADRLVDLVREHVLPDSWGHDGASIVAVRGVLWVRQTDEGHRQVEELLQRLGVIGGVRAVNDRRSKPAAKR